ncbi:hypothetical protein PPBDW_II0138 [Photobacterium kishitanii]|nr:hypothetical protein PPBDW_II0138 [Photobacterium kishitanii]
MLKTYKSLMTTISIFIKRLNTLMHIIEKGSHFFDISNIIYTKSDKVRIQILNSDK